MTVSGRHAQVNWANSNSIPTGRRHVPQQRRLFGVDGEVWVDIVAELPSNNTIDAFGLEEVV